MTGKKLLYFMLFGFLFFGCSKENNPNNESESGGETGWIVPIDKLIISQLPPDPIPSIDAPYFQVLDDKNLNSDEIVFVYRYEDIVKVYPQRIMEVHEIVNDKIGDHYFAITFCPLTGSALAWTREINGEVTEFGVSGHLYNENLIPYDRNTNSFWSQMSLQSIKGIHAGFALKNGLLLSTSASTIQQSYPSALVLVDTSVFSKKNVNNSLKQANKSIESNVKQELFSGDYFGIANHGISHDDEVLLFNYDNFVDSVSLIQINYGKSNLLVAGSKTLQFIVAFKNNTIGSDILFHPIQNALPIIFGDNKGNRYDLSGLVVSGPLAGSRLTSPISYTAHSFAWDLFFGDRIEFFDK